MIADKVIKRIEVHLKEKVESEISISGGCISDASIIKMNSGEKYFLKVNNHIPKDMFSKEANGLAEIEKSNSIRVPSVKLAEENFILLECIEGKSKSKNFFEDFGIEFAKMHKYESSCFWILRR